MKLLVILMIASVSLFFLGVGSSAVKISITPDHCISTLQKTVTINCTNDADPDSPESLTLIELARNGEDPMVYMRDCTNATFGEDWSRRLKAVIGSNGGQTYLDVTLNDPTSLDSGIYTCTVLSIDTHGRRSESSASANLVVESLEVRTLESRLISMSHKLTAMEERMESFEHKHNENVNKTEADMTALETSILEKMSAADKNQEDQILDMNKTANYRSAFSAVLSSTVYNVKEGQVIIFDTMKTQEGVGYNNTTGVFTAQIRGLYVFHLGFNMYAYHHVYLSIIKNEKTLATAVGSEEDIDEDHASCSTVTVLEPGDTVMVKCTNRNSAYNNVYYSRDTTVFTGYLLQPL